MLSKWVTSVPSAVGHESSWGTLVTTAWVLEGEERLHEQLALPRDGPLGVSN